MFFYRFSCFISLVANVAKKSSKSFWDGEDLCNQFAWVGLGQKGFEAVFSSYSWDFSYSPQRHGGTALHEASRGFTGHHGASQDITGFMASLGTPQRHGGPALHRTSWHFTGLLGVRRASPLSPVLATRAVSATALATDLATRFSPNSYVFL